MIRNEWDNIVGRRNRRFTWDETLRYMAFAYHTHLKCVHAMDDERDDPETHILNLIVDRLLSLPNLLKDVTHAFPLRRRIIVPSGYPGPPPTQALFDETDEPRDSLPSVYTLKVVTFRRHTLVVEVGNVYVPPKRFELYCGPGIESIKAMHEKCRSDPNHLLRLYDQPVPPELQMLVDQLTPYLEWTFYCVSVVAAKHPITGLIKSRTRSGRAFHYDE